MNVFGIDDNGKFFYKSNRSLDVLYGNVICFSPHTATECRFVDIEDGVGWYLTNYSDCIRHIHEFILLDSHEGGDDVELRN